tara:strand:- start:457189 stop:459333 length:2145 start_codon:yes stop_codon:yes gene_type:complete
MRAHSIRLICLAAFVIFSISDGVSATRPEVMLDSDPLINKICTSSSANVITSTTAFSSLDYGAEFFVYQAGFNAATKSGILQKRRVSLIGESKIGPAIWDAADLIKGDGRKIYTSRISEEGALITIPFAWDRLSKLQKDDLSRSPVTQKHDQFGQDRLAYLRGVDDREHVVSGIPFRKRRTLLGPIVHSSTAYVGKYPLTLPDERYPTPGASRSRKPALFIGANDGALHAFNADGGAELFAYIPNVLFPKLSVLTEPEMPYTPFVDGGMAIEEVKVIGHWRTVLVSALGGGAQGVFALDVSNVEKFEQGEGALWEFSDVDDPDMGHVVATPLIAKFRIDTGSDKVSYRYFAVVANGLNSYHVDTNKKSKGNAPNSLFLLSINKPKDEPWLEGENYFKIVFPSGVENIANGLTGATTVLDSAGAVQYLYLADLQGNIWRVDFDKNAPWLHSSKKIQYKPVFVAQDDVGNRQPITQAPVVLFARTGYLILFGTGKYMERSDVEPANFKPQSFYGVIDPLEDKNTTVSRHQLLPRILSITARSDHALELSGATASAVDRGWYLDFIDSEQSGERSVSSASVIDGQLFFQTLIPTIAPCTKNHGRAYVLDALNGLPLSAMFKSNENLTGILSTTGLWPPPIVLQSSSLPTNEQGKGERYRIRKKIVQLKPDGMEDAPSTNKRPSLVNTPIESTLFGGRLSWHEIINWNEVRQTVGRGK